MLLWLCGLKEEKRGFWKKMCKCRQHCFHNDRLSSTVYNCFPQDESIGRSIILCNVLNLFSREDQWLRRGLTEENYLLTNKQAARRSHKGRLKGKQSSHRQAAKRDRHYSKKSAQPFNGVKSDQSSTSLRVSSSDSYLDLLLEFWYICQIQPIYQ